jgi:hypothetical protein
MCGATAPFPSVHSWRAQGQLYLNYTTKEKLVIPKIHHRVQINFSINCILHSPLPTSVRPTFVTVILCLHFPSTFFAQKFAGKIVYVLPISQVLPTCCALLFIQLTLLKNNKLETIRYAVLFRLIFLPLSPKHSFSVPCSAQTFNLCSSHHMRHQVSRWYKTSKFILHCSVCR